MLPNHRLIKSKKRLKEVIKADMARYDNGRYRLFPHTEVQILANHNILLRKTEYYTNTHKRLFAKIYRLRLHRIQNKYGLHISLNVFDEGLKIMHLGPVLTNGKACCGKNITMHMNTAVVAGGRDNNAPKLGNNIILGFGSVVLGGITLADNIAIGANALVNKSFYESDIAIAGVPAKKISDNGSTTWNKKNND